MKKFGQHEELTSRLKRILTGYPFDKEVLKEMVQNADDAGASRIVFIADPRRHPAVKIGKDKWDTIGGPSLCIYNDRPFTKADIEGIQSLGEGSKGEDTLKTGQYGVGFNSVYHFTDTPMFVSEGKETGKVLCALDPHHRYVPGATADSPGQMFDRIDDLEAACPRLLDAFLVNEFPLKNSTMFRFPLRTQSQARVSKISPKAVTVKQMEALLKNLRKDMMECLLFLNNVSAIEVGHMNADGKYEKIFGARIHLSAADKRKQQTFVHAVKKTSRYLKEQKVDIESVRRVDVQYVGQVQDSEGRVQKWQIAQVLGFSNAQQVHQSVRKAYSQGELGMLPRAGVAMMLECNGVSLRDKYKELHRLYCFLPLPIQINLPMHINGHFALDHESRRDLWHDDNNRGFRSKWNDLLLQDLIAPAYVKLMMESAKDRVPSTGKEGDVLKQIEIYYQLFPRSESYSDKYLTSLCDVVYKLVAAERCLPVCFPGKDEQVSVEWYKPTGCYVDSFGTFGHTGSKSEKHKGLIKTLLRCKFPFLQGVPWHINQRLRDAGGSLKNVEPANVAMFLCDFKNTSPVLKDMCQRGPVAVDRTVFESAQNMSSLYRYIMGNTNGKKILVRSLEGLPLLLTAAGEVRKFRSKDKVILSTFSDLAVGAGPSGQFVHPLLVESLGDIRHDTAVFSDLTVQKLADILGQSQLKGLAESKSCEMGELAAIHPEGEAGGKVWLARMWTFLAKCAEVNREGLCWSRQSTHESERQAFATVSPLHHWCLVPVQKKEDISLICLDAIASALDEYHRGSMGALHTYEAAIHAALKRLGLPQPCYAVLQDTPSGAQLMSKWVTSLDKPDGVLFALSEQFKKCGDVNESLLPAEVDAVMTYFSYNLACIQGVHCAVSTLQQLPGYTTMSGRVVNLVSCCAYVLPKHIPTIEMEAWMGEGDIVFLQHVENPKIQQLLKYIGCMVVTVTEVYCQFVFPHFDFLSEEARDTHMEYVRDLLVDKHSARSVLGYGTDERSTLIQAIKELAFIQDSEGSTKTVRHFYDPREDVFVRFKKSRKLLPERYRSEQWYSFLEECGLKHNITEEMFLEFARSLEGEEIDENFHQKSQALLQCLCSSDHLHTTSFLHKVRDIAFLAPHKVGSEHLAIHSQFRQKGDLKSVSFKGAVWQKAEDLAWTNCDIIPGSMGSAEASGSWWLGYGLQHSLGIVTEPRVEKVIEHMENISQKMSVASTEDFQQHAKAMEKISAKLVAYLDKKKASLTPEQVQGLSCLKFCVYIDRIDDDERCMLPVRPNQLVLSRSSDHELYPYIVSCPSYLHEHKELMKLLGMQSSLSLHQLARVLEEIYESSAGGKLHPNEHIAAEKATAGFLGMLEKCKSTFDGAKLYLLCDKGTIRSAVNIVINNSEELYKRIAGLGEYEGPILLREGEFMGKVSDFQVLRALRQLPTELRPSLLTTRYLEHVHKGETKFTEDCSQFAQELKDRFCHEDFISGVSRLLEHASISKASNQEDDTNQENQQIGIEEIQNKLMAVKVRSADRLVTNLISAENEKMEHSSRSVDYFIGTEDDGTLTIYVTPEIETEIFYGDLAERINHLFSGVMHNKSLARLESILRGKLGGLRGLLDRFEIPGGSVKRKAMSREEAFEPGQYVPVDLHHLLAQEILHFSKEEIIAIELDDPINSKDHDHGANAPTYIFAKIVAKVPAENEDDTTLLGSRYTVRIGQNKQKIYPVTSLYRFERQHRQATSVLPSISDIKNEVQEQLEAAHKLSTEERDNIVKRLTLKWLDDTRPGIDDIRQDILDIISSEVQRLRTSDTQGCAVTQHTQRYRPRRNSCRGYHGGSTADSNSRIMDYLVRRSQQHSAARAVYNDNLSQSRSNPGERVFSHRDDVVVPNPQLGESYRWLQQAAHDLARAGRDDGTESGAHQWNCSVAYQVWTF